MAAGVHHQVASHSSGASSESAKAAAVAPSSFAVQIEPTERTPLIRKKVTFAEQESENTQCCWLLNFKLVLIGLILTIGLTIASYLLVIDTQSPPLGIAYDLVSREAWSSTPNESIGSPRLNPPSITNILFTQTRGDSCDEIDSCIVLLRSLEASYRAKNVEIPYNFMIGGDGGIYEGKGWTRLSGYQMMPQEQSLVVSFVGNFTEIVPPQEQLDAGKALISEGLKLGKIRPNFRIYGIQNLTISHQDGAALYENISTWPHFDTILKVL